MSFTPPSPPLPDSSLALQTETSAIVCAAFVGALGWECAYNLPYDLRLLFCKPWLPSPVRILSRLAYLLSRYCALSSLMLNISYWYYPHGSDSFCEKMPYVVESLMAFSYFCTLIILMLRTIALYPTSRWRDWMVFYSVFIILLVNLAFAIWLPFNVRGKRPFQAPSRCIFVQSGGDVALRSFLFTAVVFDIIVLSLTVFKLFSSGTYLFYSSTTLIGRCIFKSGPTSAPEGALTRLAAELIGQGLYDFAAITFVGCGALVAYLTITVVIYQAMALNCIAAISAALAGGVFRETARAASTMKAVYEVEERNHRQSLLATSPCFDKCDISDVDVVHHAIRHDKQTRQMSSSRRAYHDDRLPKQMASEPKSIAEADCHRPPSLHPAVHTKRNEEATYLPLQMSLRAFEDGEKRVRRTDTLSSVSVIGANVQEYEEDGSGSDYNHHIQLGLSPPPRTVRRAPMVGKHER